MKIDDVVKCCKDAFVRAREKDESWTGTLRKPPEYLITVFTAEEITNLYQARARLTLEANAKDAIEDALIDRLNKEQSAKFARKRLDILLERVYKNTIYPWAIIEIKNGEYGFKGHVLENDLDRLCTILSFDHWAIHYGLLVTYYVLNQRSSEAARDSIQGKIKKRWERIQAFVKLEYPDLKCKKYPSRVDTHSHDPDSNSAWGVDVVRIGKWN